jgi:hypothetical protein
VCYVIVRAYVRVRVCGTCNQEVILHETLDWPSCYICVTTVATPKTELILIPQMMRPLEVIQQIVLRRAY